MRVVWSPSSLRQILNVYTYIASYNPAAASSLVDALMTAGDSLAAFPYRGRPVGENLRELTLIHPYLIRYRIVGNEVYILRVRHGAQRPD